MFEKVSRPLKCHWWLNKEEETDELVSFSNVIFGIMERGLGLKLSNCLKPGKVTSWLLKLSIGSLYPEKSGNMFCIIPMVRSCHSYIGSGGKILVNC